MDVSVFLARFWGSLFMILGALTITAKFLGKIIEKSKDKTFTTTTGYITFLLGLATVVAHNIWVMDWRVAVTVLGWMTLLKGIEKIALPDRVSKKAQFFRKAQAVWGFVIFAIGAVFFYLSMR